MNPKEVLFAVLHSPKARIRDSVVKHEIETQHGTVGSHW